MPHFLLSLHSFLVHFPPAAMSCSRWTWSRPYSPPLQWYIYCAVLVPQLCLTYDPMNCSPPDPLSVEFSRQEYWSGLTFPFPWDLLNPRIEPQSPALWVDSLPSEHIYTYICMCVCVYICRCIYIYIYMHTYILLDYSMRTYAHVASLSDNQKWPLKELKFLMNFLFLNYL